MGISIGLVGLGSFGSAFAGLFKAHPLVDRIALCDREPERVQKFAENPAFQDKFNPSDTYDSLDAICQSDLDALVLITQPWLHAAQAVQTMEAGKHVYSAVPIVSIPDGDEILDWCDKLIATCKRTGLHYMLGETTYYRPQAMYCRRKFAEGAFGHIVYSEGEYLHDVDHGLREVQRRRLASSAGQEWIEFSKTYTDRGIVSGPMHYPTHSTAGPICVTNAHAVNVCAWGYYDPDKDPYFGDAFSNETALFKMSNGATMRICEYRQIGHRGAEVFRIFGTQASFKENTWITKSDATPLTIDEMRDPLPQDVADAYQDISKTSNFYGGHGGSHAYLAHEFVDAIAHNRTPATNAWEAARYMAAGVMAHKSALRDGEILDVPDWGDAP
ncbi:MAG: Gfo/Idh/MocA family oxidoreductase [Candidatus Latescibacteria bacterium]|jgi:predicted dehydrogenase|nr:Gfo/Idh/MocA family oxidoreductase [Candidatus Latescibacterota bacterium]